MPSITFILPHWLYWPGLIIIPLLGMYIVRKQRDKKVDGGMSNSVAYMLLLAGGFVGLHRFYVKNIWGMLYIPLFVLLLLSNVQVRTARNLVSQAKNEVNIAKFDVEQAQAALKKGKDGAQQQLLKDKQNLEAAGQHNLKEQAGYVKWNWITRIFAMIIALSLLIDAFLLPKMVERCAEKEASETDSGTQKISMPTQETAAKKRYARATTSKFFLYIDKLNGYVGEFVCFWAIIAVFVYYYEVLARYVFNSPTNWAHEGMFLMFGMQYILAAGFANREDAHVRVDVIYRYFPPRLKGLTDVLTSVFFFLFALALLWTSWVFTADSISVWEVSFTEWAIQYWPVKLMMVIGALLLLLDGFTKLITDIYVLAGKKV